MEPASETMPPPDVRVVLEIPVEDTAVVVSVVAALILIYFCASRRAFVDGAVLVERNGAGNASCASQRIDLEKLPSFDFSEREFGSSTLSSAICLENFSGGCKCRLLPICKHSFHMECIDKWLLAKARCPICRGSANLNEMVEDSVGLGGQTDGIPTISPDSNFGFRLLLCKKEVRSSR